MDQKLKEMDVRLTMGGEPTFVSIDDMESAEWNIAADGPHKRKLAKELVFRLRESFGPTGMLHFGQGKLYPGEILPRWQYGCFWRKDGKPIWKESQLIASPSGKGKLTESDALSFAKTVVETLKIDTKAIIPAYEDAFYFAWEENKLPVDKDPLKLNLKDGIERKTLTDVLENGLNKPSGFVLPVRFNTIKEAWESCHWPLRRTTLFLVPGNSPIGYRLPLNSLPDSPPDKESVPRDPFAQYPDLEDFEDLLLSRKSDENSVRKDVCFKTALCFQINEGRLHLFLPPQNLLEHYLELAAAIHFTAKKLNLPGGAGGLRTSFRR